MGRALQRHPFSGLVQSERKLLHDFLEVSNFRGHLRSVFLNKHPLWGLMSAHVRRLNPTFGSSHIASSAYQKRPTKNHAFNTKS